MDRARTDAGRKLSQAILEAPKTDDSLKHVAKSVLNRKYSTGQPLPIQFTAIDGRKVDTSQMRGKVILVDFWATTCVPCMAGLPELKSLDQKYHEQGFEIVGISSDNEQKPVLRVIQEKGIPWPNYVDADGQTNKFEVACGVSGIPNYWLVDRHGILRETMADFDLEKKIQFLLAEPP
jgi:thiol-disulfide isomerase/thioredoxin